MRTTCAFRSARAAVAALVLASACAPVQSPAALPATPGAAVRHEVVATDGHRLALWEKRPAAPRGAILLIHGITWSSLPNFDLQVPGEQRSFMDALVARGYAAYGLDLRGYGATPRDATGWLTPDRAVRDIATALDWIRQRHSAAEGPALLGLSRGATLSAIVAQRHPDKLSAAVLFGFPSDIDQKLPPTPPDQSPAKRPNTAAAAGSDFITPGAISRQAIDAFIAAALAADPVRVDWRDEDQFNALDPSAVKVPILLIHGERDPVTTMARQAKLFTRLGADDRAWVILPGADHAAHLENSQARLVDAVIDFVERNRQGE
ncbi:MAG TPA: alpha/beta fold hydrolase [Thermoanaerobaculia bacterium]|nr:alpha/beta fold hydrolase [Thermoanaerobaculia bacterium]